MDMRNRECAGAAYIPAPEEYRNLLMSGRMDTPSCPLQVAGDLVRGV